MMLTPTQIDAIRDALLAVDDPYYLNTFNSAADEDEWFHLNEAFIQTDLQRYMPAGIDTRTPAVWRLIRQLLQQYRAD